MGERCRLAMGAGPDEKIELFHRGYSVARARRRKGGCERRPPSLGSVRHALPRFGEPSKYAATVDNPP